MHAVQIMIMKNTRTRHTGKKLSLVADLGKEVTKESSVGGTAEERWHKQTRWNRRPITEDIKKEGLMHRWIDSAIDLLNDFVIGFFFSNNHNCK